MASVVEICNRALQKLGAERITSLSDDSVSARACNVAFTPVLLGELEDHEWSCAIKRVALPADSPAPTWGRANSFTLPADFVRLGVPYPEDNTNDWDHEIEGRKILTDEDAPLYIRYVYHVTDPNEMSALFREALSAKLAWEMCEELSTSASKKESLKDDYDRVIRRARRSNAFQKPAQRPPEDTWVTVRNS